MQQQMDRASPVVVQDQLLLLFLLECLNSPHCTTICSVTTQQAEDEAATLHVSVQM